MFISLLIVAFLSSCYGTWLLKKYAVAKQIIDKPNSRSSHSIPTPRGGGVGFVVVFLFLIISLQVSGIILFPGGYLSVLSLIIVASLGFYDDLHALSPVTRLVLQLLAASLIIYTLSPIPAVQLIFFTLNSGFVLTVLLILYLVWLLNLYNFMDGINGIASVEAICACGGISLIYLLAGNPNLSTVPLLLVVTVLGFLPWNFPKAQIFMGDAGSSFLGFILGLLSLQGLVNGVEFFWCWLILLGIFIVDASVTLLKRIIQGEKVYVAHCSHAYQHAAKRYKCHTPVTNWVLIINVVWLWPIAMLVGLKFIDGIFGLIVAYIPLLVLSKQFDAGKTVAPK